ncbi:MAG: glutaconyl-CoA decarboxylase subunit gamma, partial [Herpetosiphonaceae bacterium]|nr:glutaconyl-CoA decarboxylase subunit gamma [Herpetosiphonaceae bacterium]
MKIQPFRQFLAVIALSAVLSGCAGDQPEGSQALRQLPTVTAVVATEPPAATPPPPTRTIARPTATAIPTPSAVPQIVETA